MNIFICIVLIFFGTSHTMKIKSDVAILEKLHVLTIDEI